MKKKRKQLEQELNYYKKQHEILEELLLQQVQYSLKLKQQLDQVQNVR